MPEIIGEILGFFGDQSFSNIQRVILSQKNCHIEMYGPAD
jgi:hypothetical protein